ncbi:MAG: hypothetical protein GXO10_06430 [Crenarchaeota archaeon]|nr:hypothetical protein [Thermoproteota archaeon]
MRYALIYLLITIAFIAATIYVAYTIFNIGRSSAQNYDILQAVRCIYTRSICITTESVIQKSVTINGKTIHLIIIGKIAIPTTKTIEGNCTNPPCIIVSKSSEIYISPE